jgi:uncharacterized protein (TIGR02246 family)
LSIDDLYKAWSDAIRRGDVEAIIELITPDYVLWAPGQAPIVGRDSLREMLAPALSTYDISSSFERTESLVAGDLAVDFGWDVQTVTPRAGGEARAARQRVVLVMRRQPDGRWLFARGMSQPGPVTIHG